jgi:hypothetical protein
MKIGVPSPVVSRDPIESPVPEETSQVQSQPSRLSYLSEGLSTNVMIIILKDFGRRTVCWLDISMDYTLSMAILERIKEILED